MRYVVSDIHGNFHLLVKYLKKVNFNSNDILYVLGDVLDKGKDIVKLIDLLFHKLKNNCVVIAGNHEYDFSKYVKILISDNLDDETILKKVQDYLQIEKPISFEDIETILNLLHQQVLYMCYYCYLNFEYFYNSIYFLISK